MKKFEDKYEPLVPELAAVNFYIGRKENWKNRIKKREEEEEERQEGKGEGQEGGQSIKKVKESGDGAEGEAQGNGGTVASSSQLRRETSKETF